MQTDSPSEKNFSVNDLEKLEPIFTWLFILFQIALMFGLIWTGWKGVLWYWVIPMGGVIWFGNKMLKQMFQNQFDSLLPEARKAEAITDAVDVRPFATYIEDVTAEVRAKHDILGGRSPNDVTPEISSKSATLFILIATILPAALWYGVGAGLAKLLS